MVVRSVTGGVVAVALARLGVRGAPVRAELLALVRLAGADGMGADRHDGLLVQVGGDPVIVAAPRSRRNPGRLPG